MGFNIKKKAVSPETTFLHLRDPGTDDKLFDDQGNAVGINLYGKASKQYRQALSELTRKNLQRKNKPQGFETNVEDNVNLLVAISDSTENLDYEDTPVASAADFKKLYSDPELFWIRDQVTELLEDTSAFLQK